MTTHTHLFKMLGILHVQLTEEKRGHNIYSYSKLDILHPCGTVFKYFNIMILVSFSLIASFPFSCVHMQRRATAPINANGLIRINTTSNMVPSYCLIMYTLYYLSIILGVIKVGSANKHQYVLLVQSKQ